MHRSQRFWHSLNAFWKSCSVRVFSTIWNSASITSDVSKRPFLSFIFNRWNKTVTGSQVRWVGWVGDDSHVVFLGKNSLVKKGVWDSAVSWCNRQFFCRQSSGRSLRTFNALTIKHHSSMGNWLACQDKLFVDIPLDVKENDECFLPWTRF
jgi:hypothetical protein